MVVGIDAVLAIVVLVAGFVIGMRAWGGGYKTDPDAATRHYGDWLLAVAIALTVFGIVLAWLRMTKNAVVHVLLAMIVLVAGTRERGLHDPTAPQRVGPAVVQPTGPTPATPSSSFVVACSLGHCTVNGTPVTIHP
ncbi:hypothetical protein GCM10009839_24190 [Catenulispora yoronensis]|uniref:Uncharacterized protein n=1 Tax=Catenulispora yoronensis TaxID=450799 RepID=A0ABN2U0V4_9ACTN